MMLGTWQHCKQIERQTGPALYSRRGHLADAKAPKAPIKSL